MIAERALQLAGDGAVLVARPKSDVAHVYVGPLTPSGGAVPRRRRAVCRAHTRRLVALPERWSSLGPHETGPSRLCARCSVRLTAGVGARRTEPVLVTREQYAAAFADLTARDVWAQAVMAETLEELQAVAHVSLVVLGHRECNRTLPFLTQSEPVHGRFARMHQSLGTGARNLTELIGRLRERLADYPNRHRGEALTALIASGYAQTKAERQQAWRDREDRIARLGITNATA